MNRRDFLKRGAAVSAVAAMLPYSGLAAVAGKRSLKKGIMWGTVGIKGSVLDKIRAVKEAGFEGVEMNSHMDQKEVLKAQDADE